MPIVAFRSFANTPKNTNTGLSSSNIPDSCTMYVQTLDIKAVCINIGGTSHCSVLTKRWDNPPYVLVISYCPFISLHVDFLFAVFSSQNGDQRSPRSTMMQFIIAYCCTKEALEVIYCHCEQILDGCGGMFLAANN